jgi:hypothetical protein
VKPTKEIRQDDLDLSFPIILLICQINGQSPSLSSHLDSSKALDSMILSSSSSESIQRPISKVSVFLLHQIAYMSLIISQGLYTLPNDHIVVEPSSSNVDVSPKIGLSYYFLTPR